MALDWRVVAVGKPKLAYAAAGIGDYEQRLRTFGSIACRWVKDEEALLTQSEGCWRVALDERGAMPRSRELAQQIEQWELRPEVRTVALCVGGADGHSEVVRKRANYVWSLSTATLQHELALLIALEQIYRAYTILRGLPYHRE